MQNIEEYNPCGITNNCIEDEAMIVDNYEDECDKNSPSGYFKISEKNPSAFDEDFELFDDDCGRKLFKTENGPIEVSINRNLSINNSVNCYDTDHTSVYTDNKENMLIARKFKSKSNQAFIPNLTIEEGKILLETWDENHFTEFNSWLQVARAKAHFQIDERTSYNSSGDRTVKTKNYQCNLQL